MAIYISLHTKFTVKLYIYMLFRLRINDLYIKFTMLKNRDNTLRIYLK